MFISVLKEEDSIETRVSATPDSVRLLKRLGAKVYIENNAGLQSGYYDDDFKSAGAEIVDRKTCISLADICLTVRMPPYKDFTKIKKNLILIGMLDPFKNTFSFKEFSKLNIITCSLELLPRI